MGHVTMALSRRHTKVYSGRLVVALAMAGAGFACDSTSADADENSRMHSSEMLVSERTIHALASGRQQCVVAGDTGAVVWKASIGWPAGAIGLSDGGVAVLDIDTGVALVFTARGDLRTLIGRRGRGPGEMTRNAVLRRWRGDTLAVFDDELKRISLFLSEGHLVRTIPTANVRGLVYGRLLGRFASGEMVFRVDAPLARNGGEGTFRQSVLLLRWQEADSMVSPLFAVSGAETLRLELNLGSMFFTGAPFGHDTFVGVADSVLVVVDNAESVVRYFDNTGAARGSIRLAVTASPVSRREQEAAAAEVESISRGRVAAFRVPASGEHPIISLVRVEASGAVWLELGRPVRQSGRVWVRVTREQGLTHCVEADESDNLLAGGPSAVLMYHEVGDDAQAIWLRPTAVGQW